jgi:glycosyltransferase involved in cell wall biosynthesis
MADPAGAHGERRLLCRGVPEPARVIVARGHQVTPWELRPWERLPARFSVSYLETGSNLFDAGSLRIERVPVATLRDKLPRGKLFDIAALVAGDRYLDLEPVLTGANIVHAEELAYWFAADAAKHRRRLGYKLVQTVWETLPMVDAYRNRNARANRRLVLEATDLFLAATERARRALLLEGVPEERIEVSPPGVETDRFATAPQSQPPPAEHLILSAGRLVWEKGHHDVLRAVAALHKGLVANPAPSPPRVLLVGSGPEEERLRAHASDLGIADYVELASLPYDEMPGVYARASCIVLASLPHAACELPPMSNRYRCFWEEQFGMVLAEAMAARLAIVAARSGAIPEVTRGSAELFTPGDWFELARTLARGPLARAPGARVEHPQDLVRRYSNESAARRLAAAYDRVLAA